MVAGSKLKGSRVACRRLAWAESRIVSPDRPRLENPICCKIVRTSLRKFSLWLSQLRNICSRRLVT